MLLLISLKRYEASAFRKSPSSRLASNALCYSTAQVRIESSYNVVAMINSIEISIARAGQEGIALVSGAIKNQGPPSMASLSSQ